MRQTLFLAALTTAMGLAEHAAATDLEVRFCPAGQARSYPLNSERGAQGLVLQNLAIVNAGLADIHLSGVRIELLRDGEVVDSRRLGAADLTRVGKGGQGLQASGLMKLAGFQFCGEAMISSGMTLAGPDLGPSQALLVTSQTFAWRGARDTLRVTAAGQSLGHDVAVVADLPIVDKPAPVTFRFPLQGAWYVAAGPSFHTQHRWGVQEEFAFDIIRVGTDGRSYRGTGARFSDYYAYGQPVLAAADGQVVAATDGAAEHPEAMRRPDETDQAYMERLQADQAKRLAEGLAGVVGNYVTIAHGGVYSTAAHLQPGSVLVKPGDLVKAGQVIGKLGSSGNSTEPHLHWQVCDGPDPLACAGLPATFTGLKVLSADLPRPLQSGDVVIAP